MSRLSTGDKKIKAIKDWFADTFPTADDKMIAGFVNTFCEEYNFKMPRGMSNKNKANPRKILRQKHQFVIKNWDKFVHIVGAYFQLANDTRTNRPQESDTSTTEGPNTSGANPAKSLVDSLITV